METFSALLAICAGNSPVPGEFPTQRPVTRSFDVYFDLRLNKRLCKQSCGWWFETLLCPLWRHSNEKRRSRALFLLQSQYHVCSDLKYEHPFNLVFETLHWRHNDHGGVSNHQPQGCLINRLFRRRSKKISKFRITGLCAGNSPGPVNSPHKELVTRKIVPFDDVIMEATYF